MNLKNYVLEKESELEAISSIRVMDLKSNRSGNRLDSEIDYARVLYCSSFRRLQGKMQLLVPGSIHFYRNRLTHSLEVSQIARSIARRLELMDELTVQTCSLAHDIGNPPFGHAGEKILSKLNSKHPYEGNAQTFRILNHIEEKHHELNGLNLTIRTLLGITKYPNNYTQNNEKFLYDEDYNLISTWKEKYKFSLRTIDCEIMDLSDEIAYAAHDLEDALRMKYFNIDDLIFEFEKNDEFSKSSPIIKEIVSNARKFANNAKTYKTPNGYYSSEEYSILFLKELTSLVVDKLVCDIDVVQSNGIYTLGYKNYSNLAKGLKKLTFNAVKRRRDVIQYELLGEKVLSGLYQVFTDIKFNKDQILLPTEYRQEKELERTTLDYIGGMMDIYAIDQYKLYFGQNSLEKLYLQQESDLKIN